MNLELWGGAECTINRVGDSYVDQLAESGHYDRPEDLDLFAALGISAIRYPILWERALSAADTGWRWHTARLTGLGASEVRPIIGLLHHGSGPAHTNLLDPDFPAALTTFAKEVAERYSWIDDWTPINEPNTTARFSALYGHWYPHHRDESSFWLALLNQIDATRMAMRAIRCVNPAARLIQTDDLGLTYATSTMRDQAAFDNTRRWASWDLLCGEVTVGHPLWHRLVELGYRARLDAIADDPCPPSVIGLNHYLTSDRFLDHRFRRYPHQFRGGNAHRPYADVEAIRVLDPPPAGLAGAIREAWGRYRIPIALTEIHNGCTRDEQMRWLAEAWDTSLELRTAGVDVVAVTAWSLLGAQGWDTLLTVPGRYEVGAYDTTAGEPRPTAVVPLLKGLPAGKPRHPVLTNAGWWRRKERLLYPVIRRPAPLADHERNRAPQLPSTPLLVCGATGTLGQAFAAACRHRNIDFVLATRAEIDVEDERSIATALDRLSPWGVVNATGWVRVDDAELHPRACMRINADGAAALARACAEREIQSAHFSSDLVFDGRSKRPYRESDAPSPLNVYGHSKAAMEQSIGALDGRHLVIRTAAFFSPFDDANFAAAVERSLSRNLLFEAPDDEIVSPTYVPDLVNRTLDLLIDGETGLWHLANHDALSWAAFARRLAVACGWDVDLVRARSALPRPALRPKLSSLATSRGSGLGPLDEAIGHYREIRCSMSVQT